ncbi:hypothetical protein DRW41_16385 [Neobacillus piezotolerans]|uniref:Na+-translocating membrane potential-generating system MpsC domain-containing protein n=1 Tax=Neobacillus piezotolerans TaxID=2259171 RepID=A0A3D8GML4_9BACI|nr:Na-translocating system protein MpsC family protein [Neobacillus piezotolerans]RDU35720.1 hypothetical protein DRW41_16385 [Neobacillus piezotolerans]
MEVIGLEKEVGGYIGKLLRDNFGRGPGAVHCTYAEPFITVHITNFLSPMEKSLMYSKQNVYVEKTRDLLMETLIEEIKSYFTLNIGRTVEEFYYDWNLDSQTGAFIVVLSPAGFTGLREPYRNKEKVHREIVDISIDAQKPPEETYSELLSPRVLLIARTGILVQIEKELILLGFEETLKLAKRSLEKKLLGEHQPAFENYLYTQIEDVFVDWNFQKDLSYILIILKG